jgi:aminobenzoyl-glutamate utilization protein B
MKTVVKCVLHLSILAVVVPGSLLLGSDEPKAAVISRVEKLTSQIDEISDTLWDCSELGLKEHQTAAYLVSILEKAGFQVERGVAEMPTAFVGTVGRGRPVIGILAEYDALPGVGNQPVPERKPREDGVSSGHGCGHNLFGAASVGAAIALKQIMEEQRIEGTLKLFGTPAEETLIGKVYMVKAGVFDGLDAVLDWHPGTTNEVKNHSGRAMNNFEIEFFGQAAHAAGDPWNGRSALDAVELLNDGVNLMREHVMPTTRIHYVIPAAGEAPNVVPEYTKVWYYVRDINRKKVQEYYDWILRIAEGAALATGTTHKVHLIAGAHEYLLNRPLQEAIQANLELVRAPEFTEQEQQFGHELQRYVGVEEVGFIGEVKPLADEPEPPRGGSTDVAEVSYMAPTAGFSIATAAEGIPWHSWATTACHGMSAGRKGAVVAAKVLAATGADLLTNPDLVKSLDDFFQQATEGRSYVSPIPLDQKPPVPSEDNLKE